MDDFSKYEKMRDSGSNPRQIHEAGKADGLDAITLIRLVRKVFDLSLADTKRAIGAGDWLANRRTIRIGSLVHWEDLDAEEGVYLMQARVASIEGEMAQLEQLKKYRMEESTLAEVRLDGPDHRELAVSFLERPVTERLEDALRFFQGLASIHR